MTACTMAGGVGVGQAPQGSGRSVWLVDGIRTPFGRFCGGLRDVPLVDLGAHVIRCLLERTAWPVDGISELNVGVAMLEGGLMVPARQMAFAAGLPETLPTLTVDRACCSGMTAVAAGMRAIALGARSAIAVGAESMSRTPRLLHETRWGKRRGDLVVEDILLLRSPLSGTAIATYAGVEALARGVPREEQDAWALGSHERYFRALAAGWFDDEISAVDTAAGAITDDEQPRKGLSLEGLGRLPCVYDSPTVTAGNAPGLNDGACALLLAHETALADQGVEPLAEVVDYVQIAGAATSAVYMPGVAVRQLVDRAGIGLDDLDVIEINEAFAATAVVSLNELADGDRGLGAALAERTNSNGGAVALGHPTGASGARITLTAARRLRQASGRWAVAAICGGFGQTDALLLRAP